MRRRKGWCTPVPAQDFDRASNVLAILVGVIAVMLVTACGSSTPTPAPPATPTPTTAADVPAGDPFGQDYWDRMNTLLVGAYGLPPVLDTELINTAAFAVSTFLSEVANVAVNRLESHDIPWNRTGPICYHFDRYIGADMSLRQATTPLDFILGESTLVERVQRVLESADGLVEAKLAGEPLVTHSSEERCVSSFIAG